MARNKQEAQTIQKIIKFFKFHMHELDEATGGRYFRVPSEFEIHYHYNDQKNNYLYELSRCVCNSVEVDYGGDNFQTFRQFDGEGAETCKYINDIIIYRNNCINKSTNSEDTNAKIL